MPDLFYESFQSCARQSERQLHILRMPALNKCGEPWKRRLAITVWFMNKYFPAVRRMIAIQHRRC